MKRISNTVISDDMVGSGNDPETGKLLEGQAPPSSPQGIIQQNNNDDEESNPSSDAIPRQRSPSKAILSSSWIKATASCALYSFCSVSMVLVNKSLASRYVL